MFPPALLDLARLLLDQIAGLADKIAAIDAELGWRVTADQTVRPLMTTPEWGRDRSSDHYIRAPSSVAASDRFCWPICRLANRPITCHFTGKAGSSTAKGTRSESALADWVGKTLFFARFRANLSARVSQSRSRCPLRRAARIGVRAPFVVPVRILTSASARDGLHLSHGITVGLLLNQLNLHHSLCSVIVISVVGFTSRNLNFLRRSAATASVTDGRALR